MGHTSERKREDDSNNWRSVFVRPALMWRKARQHCYLHTFGEFQPDLNWECDVLRQKLYIMVWFWPEGGVGRFRCNTALDMKKPEFVDRTPDKLDGTSPTQTLDTERCHENRPSVMWDTRQTRRNKLHPQCNPRSST